MKVLAILNNGFEELEATGTIVTLLRAGYEVDLVSDDKKLKGKHLYNLQLNKTFSDINYDNYDLLFIPGGGYVPSPKTNEAILYFYNHGKYIAAICSGPTYLGKLGLLKGKKYVCFPALNSDFGGTFINDYVVCDGKLFTARSVSASILLPLKIVEVVEGKTALQKLRKQMEFLD